MIYTVDVPAEMVRKIEGLLNITDEVVRFLITKPDLNAIAKANTAKAEKAKKAAERGDRGDDDREDRSTPEEE